MQKQKHIQSFNDIAKKNSNNLAINSEVSSWLKPSVQELSKAPVSVKPLRNDFSKKAR